MEDYKSLMLTLGVILSAILEHMLHNPISTLSALVMLVAAVIHLHTKILIRKQVKNNVRTKRKEQE